MSERYPGLAAIDWPDTPFPLAGRLMLVGRRGSEAHGTYIPPEDAHGIDDRDVLGVYACPREYYLGRQRQNWDHAESIKGVWDVVLYEVRKFVGLLMQQNPNVLSLLWLEPEDYIYVSRVGRLLLSKKHLFQHRGAARNVFVGYAHGQLKRMTTGAHQGYMGAKRKGLVEKFGYDTKNAAHLIRILHMGIEYIESGQLHVRRTWDREMLLDIKRGGWTLDQVRAEADKGFSACDAAVARSPLPERMDLAAIDRLSAELVAGGRALDRIGRGLWTDGDVAW